jgi:hypothetical protein
MKEITKISELIEYLNSVKEKEGDIAVCYSEEHYYWGSVESYFSIGYNLQIMEHAKPDGPKKSTSVRALVFGK